MDVWALGVTLYCFVFGKVPYMADNVLDMYEKIRSEPYVCPFSFLAGKSIAPGILTCVWLLCVLVFECNSPISAFRLTFPSPIPPDLQDLLQRLLTKDPEKRITLQQVKVTSLSLSLSDAIFPLAHTHQKHPWVTGGS